jgi:NAD+ diphosphatase
MRDIMPSRPNLFADSPLDRAAERRDDEAWVAAALASPDALFAPVWRTRSLLAGDADAPRAGYLSGDMAAALVAAGAWAFLGLLGGRPVFAVDASPLAETEAARLGLFGDLRAASVRLPPGDAAVLAHARALVWWRSRHGFCGVCGHACAPRSAGHAMVCPNCKAEHFPRTDCAVIMLVHRDGKALLGHSARFPSRTMYSTLAGFLEPGESLEEAVRREVKEEAGIDVGRVQYHSSQPWPFPSSVMLGFVAEALSDEITIDRTELLDARWFSRADIRDRRSLGFDVPPQISIARRLIEDWLAAE